MPFYPPRNSKKETTKPRKRGAKPLNKSFLRVQQYPSIEQWQEDILGGKAEVSRLAEKLLLEEILNRHTVKPELHRRAQSRLMIL